MSADVRLPLSPDELARIEAAAMVAATPAVIMQGRKVGSIRFRGASWSTASFAQSHFRGTHFEDCAFDNVTFRSTSWDEVSFTRCTFQSCSFHRSALRGASFVDCALTETRARGAQLSGCRLQDCKLEGLVLEEAQLRTLQQDGGTIAEAHLSECTLDGWLLQHAQISNVRLTLCEAEGLTFDGSQVHELTFLGGTFARLRIQGGSVQGLAFVDAEGQSLDIEGAQRADSVHFKRGSVGRLIISRCSAVSDLYLWASQLTYLELSHGTFDGWVTECQVGPASRVDVATLLGMFWDGSEIYGLAIEQTAFEEAICARQTRFHNLRLRGVSYAPNLKLVLDGASFESSDVLGGGP